MSAVERALKRLREARTAAQGDPPIARVMVDAPTEPDAVRTPRKKIVFDLVALRKAGLYTPDNQRLADQYRIIKQPLLKHATGYAGQASVRANLIMVGSAFSGEGKTFTCVNLSLSLASEKDWEVLLVDADCKKPQLGELLGVRDEAGLLDLLEEEHPQLESRILETSVPGLSVLPLGKSSDQAAESFASDRMKAVCDYLTTRSPRRLVVFDSSPLLLTTESSILAAQLGQVVVVVQAGRTPQHSVQEAIEKLDTSKAIGLVLNRASDFGGAHYGGYGAYAYPAEGRRVEQSTT